LQIEREETMKHPERIVYVLVWGLVALAIAAEVYVNIKYGRLPINEVPSWALRFLIAR
jgi:hypothetical protein